MILKSRKVVVKALPDWLMRREKRQSAALLGRSGTRRTRVQLRSSLGHAWHLTPFDDADVDSMMFIQSGKVAPARLGGAPGCRVIWLKLFYWL